MTIPVLAIAVGSLLIYSAITGQNPLAIIKTVLGAPPVVADAANTGATIGDQTIVPNRGKSTGGTF